MHARRDTTVRIAGQTTLAAKLARPRISFRGQSAGTRQPRLRHLSRSETCADNTCVGLRDKLRPKNLSNNNPARHPVYVPDNDGPSVDRSKSPPRYFSSSGVNFGGYRASVRRTRTVPLPSAYALSTVQARPVTTPRTFPPVSHAWILPFRVSKWDSAPS